MASSQQGKKRSFVDESEHLGDDGGHSIPYYKKPKSVLPLARQILNDFCVKNKLTCVYDFKEEDDNLWSVTLLVEGHFCRFEVKSRHPRSNKKGLKEQLARTANAHFSEYPLPSRHAQEVLVGLSNTLDDWKNVLPEIKRFQLHPNFKSSRVQQMLENMSQLIAMFKSEEALTVEEGPANVGVIQGDSSTANDDATNAESATQPVQLAFRPK